jgi:hypothetical protein
VALSTGLSMEPNVASSTGLSRGLLRAELSVDTNMGLHISLSRGLSTALSRGLSATFNKKGDNMTLGSNGGRLYQEQLELAQRWDKTVDYGSPISTWTSEMLINRSNQQERNKYERPSTTNKRG